MYARLDAVAQCFWKSGGECGCLCVSGGWLRCWHSHFGRRSCKLLSHLVEGGWKQVDHGRIQQFRAERCAAQETSQRRQPGRSAAAASALWQAPLSPQLISLPHGLVCLLGLANAAPPNPVARVLDPPALVVC